MFRVGQRVRLKTGTSWQIVRRVYDEDVIQTQYLSSTHMNSEYWNKPRRAEDYVGEEEEMSILYQVKDDEKLFGTRIATNSQGKIVLEMKGTGDVVAYDEADLEEVVPFTCKFRVLDEREIRHYQVPEGRLQVGDVVIAQGELLEVTGVNTKYRNAKKPSGMRLVSTEKLW